MSEPDLRRSRTQRNGHFIDRLPPHSPEAEQGVLGCILLSPNECLTECINRLGTSGEFFYDLRHQTIFNVLIQMHDKHEAIDVITLQQTLKDKQLLEQIGGLTYLSTLPDGVPSAANISYYLDIIAEKYLLRRLINSATDIVSRVYDCEDDVQALLDDSERSIIAVRDIQKPVEEKTIGDAVRRSINYIEDMHQRKGLGVRGLTTGFIDLDKTINGLSPGSMVVIAARPSVGKTSLCMNIVEHVSIDLGLPVGVFSLETDIDRLVLRMIASRARVNLRNINEGFLAERDFPKITVAAGKIARSLLHIDDASGLAILELRSRARRMVQRHGVKLFVIDYLQLLTASINGKRVDKREREIAEISSGIKSLSKELSVPILAISQINREVDRANRKPRISDLRESGSLEQDADIIGLLSKQKGDDDEDPTGEAIGVTLDIAKNKDGPTDEIPLTFLRPYTRFESAAKISDQDVPEQENLSYRSPCPP